MNNFDGKTPRTEFKYPVDSERLVRIQRYLIQHPFWNLDPNSINAEGYWIASQYWDTPELTNYHDSVEGVHSKSKIRLRSYFTEQGQQSTTIKAEVKTRIVKNCYKMVYVHPDELYHYGHVEYFFPKALLERYRKTCPSYKDNAPLSPVTTVLYQRIGFQHQHNRSRITLDFNIMSLPPHSFFNAFFDKQTSKINQPVVELKNCYFASPEVRRVVEIAGIKHRKYSKYCISVNALGLKTRDEM